MAIGVFAISAILLANTGQVSSIGNAKSEARLAFDRLMNAFSLCDRNDLARLTSPEWTYIGLDGRIYTREEYLKNTGEHCKPAPAPVLRDVQVRTYADDTAIITAAFERPDARKVASGSIRVTVVWIKQNGRWRAFTLTRLKSKQPRYRDPDLDRRSMRNHEPTHLR
jgi:Domain of unknown function (DUF4440)